MNQPQESMTILIPMFNFNENLILIIFNTNLSSVPLQCPKSWISKKLSYRELEWYNGKNGQEKIYM